MVVLKTPFRNYVNMKNLLFVLLFYSTISSSYAQFDFDYLIGMTYETVASEYKMYGELGDTIDCTVQKNSEGTLIIISKDQCATHNPGVLYEIQLTHDSTWKQVNKVMVTSGHDHAKESILDFYINHSKFHNWEKIGDNHYVSTSNLGTTKNEGEEKQVTYLDASMVDDVFVLVEKKMSKTQWAKYKKELKQ